LQKKTVGIPKAFPADFANYNNFLGTFLFQENLQVTQRFSCGFCSSEQFFADSFVSGNSACIIFLQFWHPTFPQILLLQEIPHVTFDFLFLI
jgi:hypothetical protein